MNQADLLRASSLLFLFRTLAGAPTATLRDFVAGQLLLLLSEFIPSRDGLVVLGRSEEEVSAQFHSAAGARSGFASQREAIWNHLLTEGPWLSADRSMGAVPLYVQGALTGMIALGFEDPTAANLEILTGLASLAGVALESVHEVEQLRSDVQALERSLEKTGGIVGESPAVLKLLERIGRLARRETTVLIQGESGTGKELVARLLHRGSGRAAMPFVAINCAAIADSLLESELFGHDSSSLSR